MWITDWRLLGEHATYIVCPINRRDDGTYYLGQPKMMYGWEVRRLRELCYAALECPEYWHPGPAPAGGDKQ